MIKAAIIEDNKDFRESIELILNNSEGFDSVGAYSSVEAGIDNLSDADVLLLDINLPGISGIEGIPEIKEKYPNIYILIITIFDDDSNIFKAILNGADGYLLKNTAPIRILQAIEDAASGGAPMSPIIAKRTVDLFKKYAPKPEGNYSLSPRELEVLTLLVDGLPNDKISEKLFISIQTTRNHIRHIYEKLHVHSKSQAVVKAIKENLV